MPIHSTATAPARRPDDGAGGPHLRVALALTLVVAVAIAAVSCGSSKEAGPPDTLTSTTSAPTTSPSTTSPRGASEPTGTTDPADDRAPTPAPGSGEPDPGEPVIPVPQTVRNVDGSLTGFQSPSGNIGCYIDGSGARCDIRERDWSPPPSSGCELDYGQGISIDPSGNAGFVCAGDTALSDEPPLPYGAGIQSGAIRCVSTEVEMVCSNVDNGAGFALSRQGYRIF